MLDRREHGRQRILEGATVILDAGALADFTVDSLARNLRMSKSTLYKYFESKDQVLVALVEATCRETLRVMEALDGSTSPTAADALERLIEAVAVHADRVPAAITLAYGNLPPEANQRVDYLRAAVKDRIHRLLLQGVEAGEFSVPDPALAAVAYQTALEQVVVAVARGTGHLTRGDGLRSVHHIVLNGIIARH